MTLLEKRKKLLKKREALSDLLDDETQIEKVKELSDQIGEITKQLEEINNQLFSQIENDTEVGEEEPTEEEMKRSKDWIKIDQSNLNKLDQKNMRSLASFGNGFNDMPTLELRKNESFSDRFKTNNKERLSLGKYVRGITLGDWKNAPAEKRALTTTGNGSALIPTQLSSQIIDFARNTSLFTSAGVPIYPMETNTLDIARVLKDPTAQFYGELVEQNEDDQFTLDKVTLKAKTIRAHCNISNETIMSAQNLDSVLINAFSGAVQSIIDQTMIYGQSGDNGQIAPAGIMNDTGVNILQAKQNGMSTYQDFVQAVGKIKRNNGTPTTVGVNAMVDELINLYRDDTGQPLRKPACLENMDFIVSNSLKEDETAGSDAIVFDPNALAVGIQNQITLRVVTDSDYCIKHNCTCFVITAYVDCVTLQPKHISIIKGIKAEKDEETQTN